MAPLAPLYHIYDLILHKNTKKASLCPYVWKKFVDVGPPNFGDDLRPCPPSQIFLENAIIAPRSG